MGELEVFYRAKEKEKKEAIFAWQVANKVFHYNVRADVIQTLISKMILSVERDIPEGCDWLFKDDEDKVAFKMYDPGLLKHPIYLMPELSCCLAFGAENEEGGPIVFKGLVYIQHIDKDNIIAKPDYKGDYDDVHAEPESKTVRQPSQDTIMELCRAMLEIAEVRFKVSKKELKILKRKLKQTL